MHSFLGSFGTTSARPHGSRRGSVLVEFALVAFTLYLLMVVLLDLGRGSLATQTLQSAADLMSRELAGAPLRGETTFQEALESPYVKQRIFDEDLLVIELGAGLQTPQELDAYFATLPLVNQVLRPLMFRDTLPGPGLEVLRYPGAVVQKGGGYTVLIPQVTSRDWGPSPGGVETIAWLPVVEEVRADASAEGPFSILSSSEFRGVVNLRFNYPYQAAAMSAFDPDAAKTGPSSIALADDAAVTADPLPDGYSTAVAPDSGPLGPYSGQYGLGAHYAFVTTADTKVRPYRRLISIQSVARREVLFTPQ